MTRAPRPLAVLGAAVAGLAVATSVTLAVVHPGGERPVTPPDDGLPGELERMVLGACMLGSGGGGFQFRVNDDGSVSLTPLDDGTSAAGMTAEERTVAANDCLSRYGFDGELDAGLQPTPGQALAMHDYANRWVAPCLVAHGLAPLPRTAGDYLDGDWNLYADRYEPDRIDELVAVYRVCGSAATPFLGDGARPAAAVSGGSVSVDAVPREDAPRECRLDLHRDSGTDC